MLRYDAIIHQLHSQGRRATVRKVWELSGGSFGPVLDFFRWELGGNMTIYDNLARVTDEIEVALAKSPLNKDELQELIDQGRSFWLKTHQAMIMLAARKGDSLTIQQHADLLNRNTMLCNQAMARRPGALVGG